MRGTCTARMAALLIATGLLAGCTAPSLPQHENSWLSYKFSRACDHCPDLTDTAEAINYYCAIGVDPAGCAKTPPDPHLTLSDFTQPYVFPGPAIYANLGDLRIGRDMYCAQKAGGSVACFVSNYGPAPFDPALNKTNCVWAACDDFGKPFYNFPKLNEAILQGTSNVSGGYPFPPFATVGMTFTPGSGGAISPNAVKFYTFDSDGNLLLAPALDGEGPKTTPRMCMACHGGTYDPSTHSVLGGSFLPFDVYYFQYGKGTTGDFYHTPLPSLDDQQEQFRQLNAIVKATNPTPAIATVIDGMYPDGVGNANSTAVDGFVPSGWSGHETLYTSVVRQYCRSCHLASGLDFGSFQQFKNSAVNIERLVCETHDMPHAEVPLAMFWKDTLAQNDLRDFLKSQGITGADLHDCH